MQVQHFKPPAQVQTHCKMSCKHTVIVDCVPPPHLPDDSYADVAEVPPHHGPPHPWVNIAGPEVQHVKVGDAPRAKHDPTVGPQQHPAGHHPQPVQHKPGLVKQPPP
jgi:hypothetical protein